MPKLILIKIGRTIKYGLLNIIRNGWLSVATISIILITIFMINIQTGVVFSNHLMLKDVQDKINISAYFKNDVPEEEAQKIKEQVASFPEVKEVAFVSKEEALSQFREFNKDKEVIQKSLEELGENPFGAIINIKAHDPAQYEAISQKIQQLEGSEKITFVNYLKYKSVIDNLSQEVKSNQKVALLLAVTLSIITILITFNSIRITIYSHRQEIEIMRLVGASNKYIQLPYIWEGIFYGFVAALLAVPLAYLYLSFISKGAGADSILPFSNTEYLREFLENYFSKNIFLIFVGDLILGIILGAVSSFIAIRRYLKV